MRKRMKIVFSCFLVMSSICFNAYAAGEEAAPPRIEEKASFIYEEQKSTIDEQVVDAYDYDENNCLTKQNGIYWFTDNQKEAYYNLDMGNCINTMIQLGYSEDEYPYWIREDGCKMLGSYVMVATDTNRIPKGSILKASRGWSIVVDHCVAAESVSYTLLDVCVTW